MARKTVLDMLVESGKINRIQLEQCQKEAGQTGKPVIDCLLEKEFLTPLDVAQAYASYASMPFVDQISEKMADINLLAKVPLHFLRENKVMPVMQGGNVVVLTGNPMNFQPLDELRLLLGSDVSYAVAPEAMIVDALNRYYPLEGAKEMIEDVSEEEKELDEVAFEEIEEKDLLTMASEAPIIKLVNHILVQAAKRGASDIHIEPFEKDVRVRFRIDGIMYDIMSPPKRIQGALVSRIKIMANLNIAEKRIPQDGRIAIKVADKSYDIRVSVLPTTFGERIVMRMLDKSKSIAELKGIGFSEHDFKIVKEAIERPNGIIYITGPTGSGKTTTLYSILSELNRATVNIVTVEDPVEYQMKGVSQVQVRPKVGLTFAAALRSILRQDPDIIMIGETRDQETAQIAIQAALTGHLVLSTLHTNDAPSTITRLIDMGIEPFLIASSIVLAIAQRLVRKLCPKCKEVYHPSQELLKQIGLTPKEAESITFYQPIGCEECSETGYKGRLAIFEVMPMTEKIAQLTMERADTQRIKQEAIKEGMILLVQDGLRRIKEGLTTIDEVLAVATTEQGTIE